MNEHRATIEAIVCAVRVLGPSHFTWLGQQSDVLPRRLQDQLSPNEQRSYLWATLRDRIYRDAYCPGAVRPGLPNETQMGDGRHDSLVQDLANANHGRGAWEPGWTVTQKLNPPNIPAIAIDSMQSAPTLEVTNRGLRLYIASDECRPVVDGALEVGDEVALRLPTGSAELSPGYYCAFSDSPMPDQSRQSLVRVYLAVRPTLAPRTMSILTGRFNEAGIAFRLKMLSDARSYQRRDTAVLYIPGDEVYQAAPVIAEAITALTECLDEGAPAFTLRLIPGVGAAEEPPGNESFGQHRCGLVAEGLIRAFEAGADTVRDTVKHVEDTWAEAGIDLARPHLNAASTGQALQVLHDAVALLRREHERMTSTLVVTAPETLDGPSNQSAQNDDARRQLSTSTELADTVQQITQSLNEAAVWSGDRCTWLSPVPDTDEYGHPTLSYGAIGSSLYDGGAGVGLFLAMAGALMDDTSLQATAAAAARQTLYDFPGPQHTGLYTGSAGNVLAATAIGIVCQDHDLVEQAAEALHQCNPASEHDLLSGRAGTILALLSLAQLLRNDSCMDRAQRLGEELIAQAHRTRWGLSWRNIGNVRSPDLTGLSHGASGVAAAFVELSVATGTDHYAEAARQALDYERSWFSPERRNWPDLREANRRTCRQDPQPFLRQWCHGAPGIGLARMRAFEVLGDPELQAEATTAVTTTIEATSAALDDGSLSFSLCHGLAGNADVLLEALTGTGGTSTAYLDAFGATRARTLIDRVAATGYVRHVGGTAAWPCGIPLPGVEVPSLMLGTAGIGYFYLRLLHPGRVPSLLLPQPKALADQLTALGATASFAPDDQDQLVR